MCCFYVVTFFVSRPAIASRERRKVEIRMADQNEINSLPAVIGGSDNLMESVDNLFEMSHSQDVFLPTVENQFFSSPADQQDLQADELVEFFENETMQPGQFDSDFTTPKSSVAYAEAQSPGMTTDEMGLIQDFSLDLLDSSKGFPGHSTSYSEMVNETSHEGNFHLSARALGGDQPGSDFELTNGYNDTVSPFLQLSLELVDVQVVLEPEAPCVAAATECSPASYESATATADMTPTILSYDDIVGNVGVSGDLVSFDDELLSLLMTDASMVESPATSTSSNDDDAVATPTSKSAEGDDGLKSVPVNAIGAQTYLCPVCGNQVTLTI